MKKLNFKISVGIFTLIVAVTSLLLFVSINYFVQNQKLKKTIKIAQSEKSGQLETLILLENRAKADELFIEGRFDSAMALYKELNADESLIKKRKETINEIEKSEGFKHHLEDETLKLQTEFNKEQALHRNQADSIKNLYLRSETAKDSLLKELSIVYSLLASKQKELEKVPRYEKLTFYSANRTKVTYFGESSNGKANGYGFGYYSSGSLYEGTWKDNMRNGKGTYQWIDGDKYEGDYVSDNRSGTGTYYWKNGEKYKGKWDNNMRNGYGILYDKDDNVKLKGTWKDDLLVKAEN
jgi:hypothetical protein